MSARRTMLRSSLLLCFAATVGAAPQDVPGLFNTGTNTGGGLSPIDTTDPNYALTGPGAPAKIVVPNAAWVSAPAGSAWIAPTAGTVTDPPGEYRYVTSFDLAAFLPETVVLEGDLAADNSVAVSLNGADTGVRVEGFGATTAFAVSSGFVQGINALEFRVVNDPKVSPGNPTGLLVANLVARGEPAVSEVLVSASSLTVAEPDGTQAFAIRLNRAPAAPVRVALSASSSSRECSVAPTEVVLGADNWETGAEATVFANDDEVADGDSICRVKMASSVSSDPNFAGIQPADLVVTVEDDDDRGPASVPASTALGLGLLSLLLAALGGLRSGARRP